ncbi:MAG: SpoIIE family protein phosphatase, partial [Bacteroidota bacterium]
ENKMKRLLGEYFLYYKPRDIVSGDFYWIDKYNEKTVIAASDCTGHGVPGAFVSALGISILNEILQRSVSNGEYLNPAIMLNRLRERMISSIVSTENKEDTYDGMDISICMIDKKQNTLEYAGALQPVYLVKKVSEKYELSTMKPDAHPISMTDFKDHTYQTTIVNINKGDLLYLFSDGYADQFGGKKQKKFLTINFRKLLVSVADKPVEMQKDELDKTMMEWQGEMDQVDDMMVIGIKL